MIHADGAQHRFAFTRTGPAATAEAFRQALAAAGVNANTPATVLCDGDAGLWRLQRKVLPGAAVVLDWWHAAVRFEHALQAARGLGAGTAEASLADTAVRGLERAKWRLWHGRWPGCRRRLAALCRWMQRSPVQDVAGIDKLRQYAGDLLTYLERNEAALVHYAARRRRGEPIATSFVESAVDEIIAWRMAKAQQMRWSRATVPPFLDVSSDEPAAMSLALSNVANAAEHYAAAGEPVSIELVAYGPGFTMLRADASPVQARIAELHRRLPLVVSSACQSSRRAIAQAERKSVEAILEIPGTTNVPSGVVRLSELQEQGWSYIRP